MLYRCLALLVCCFFPLFAVADPAKDCKAAAAGLGAPKPGVYGSFDVSAGVPFRTVKRLSYFGLKRNAFIEECNKKYGAGNWAVAYKLGGKMVTVDQALRIYEDGYFKFLSDRPELVDQIAREASDVYDYDPSNVQSGTDYNHQEGPRTHLQDISIRRVFERLGKKFSGTKLLQAREKGSDLVMLSPGKVPLVDPSIVIEPRIQNVDWVNPGSVEDFWQNNKYLVVKKKTRRR